MCLWPAPIALDKALVDRPENAPVEHLPGEITKTYEN